MFNPRLVGRSVAAGGHGIIAEGSSLPPTISSSWSSWRGRSDVADRSRDLLVSLSAQIARKRGAISGRLARVAIALRGGRRPLFVHLAARDQVSRGTPSWEDWHWNAVESLTWCSLPSRPLATHNTLTMGTDPSARAGAFVHRSAGSADL